MHRHLQKGWRLQRYLILAYVVIGFLAALATDTWQLPARVVDAVLEHAHTLALLATASWNPAGVRSWFAFMILLGLAWTVPLALAFSRGVVSGSPVKVLLTYLPISAACLFLAWALVDGLALWMPDLPVRESKAASSIRLVVGSAFNLGLYGSILLLLATVLACIPFGMLFVLGKRRG